MEAIDATVCRKGSIRQYSAYSGSIIAYGGFAWLPRQRKQIRQITRQRRTWMLGSGGCNQATQSMEDVTWRLGSWNQATQNMEAGTWMPVPRSRKRVPSKPFQSKRKRSGGSGGLPPPGYQSGKKKGGEAPRSPRLRAKRAGGFLTLLLVRELSNEVGGALVQGQQSSLLYSGTYFW